MNYFRKLLLIRLNGYIVIYIFLNAEVSRRGSLLHTVFNTSTNGVILPYMEMRNPYTEIYGSRIRQVFTLYSLSEYKHKTYCYNKHIF